MVLQDIERTRCDNCNKRQRDMVYNTIHNKKFKANELQIGRLLGSGGYGSVYEASYRG